jgi:hypothetical protein
MFSQQRALSFVLIGLVAAVSAGCHTRDKLPERGSKAYNDVVSAFYVGGAQVGHDAMRKTSLRQPGLCRTARRLGQWGVLVVGKL